MSDSWALSIRKDFQKTKAVYAYKLLNIRLTSPLFYNSVKQELSECPVLEGKLEER